MKKRMREIESWSRRRWPLCAAAWLGLGAVGCPAFADDPYVIVAGAPATGGVLLDSGPSGGGTGGGVAEGGAAGSISGGTGGTGGTGGSGGQSTTPSCGDGTVQGDEECDAGSVTSGPCTDECEVDCTLFHPDAVELVLPGEGPHCYVQRTGTRDWATADSDCQTLPEGHLATILSDEEFDVVTGLLSMGSDVWIGATDNRSPQDQEFGPYEWVTGEPWGYLPSGGFDQQESCVAGSCEHCIVVQVMTQTFRDRMCDESYASVCEWSPPGW
jgi:hypothetical protein